MKAEQYLFNYIVERDIPLQKIERDIGINLAPYMIGNKELMADDFLNLCTYLGITSDDIKSQFF